MLRANPERPVPFQGDLNNLPVALEPLKALPNWVSWKFVWKVDRKGIGKWTKPPYRPDNPQSLAKNNDPSTWGTYEQALAAFEARQCDGIGFCLPHTGIAAFDIDNCRDRATGAIAPEAMKIVDRAASYCEMTPSGTGLRVIGYGIGAKTHRKQKLAGSAVEVESYRGAERYITVTGNPLPGILEIWPHMVDIGDVIDAVVAELDGVQVLPLDGVKDEARQNLAARPQANAVSAGTDTGDALLPRDLVELIENGAPPQDDWSAAFHHAVCWLADCGWSAERIERRIAGKPIVPERFAGRLRGEIDRCLRKADTKANETASQSPEDEPASSAEIEILRLAKLPAVKYEQERKDAAKALGFRASMLDRLVQAERARLGFDDDDAVAPALYAHWNVEMAGEPIDGEILLRALKEAIRRYVFASDDQALVVALWIVFSWLHEHVTHSPILFVTSAERDSGKTTLLGMVNFLARRSLLSVDISGAALFRSITKWEPTLIVDEADDALVDNVDLRSVINSGWTRGQGTVRCHPDTHEPELFSTFAPKVVAMKGRNLPDTTLSRSIIITMRPRRADDPEEHAADFDHLDNETFARLRAQAMRWAADNGEVIARATPEIPSGFHNRRRANWKPLLAIAEACGWKTDGWKAALAIEAVADTFDPSLGVELLLAIKAAFKASMDRITSADLIGDLTADETARWATYNKGKPISQRQVANLLKPYGIKPKTIRLGDGSTPRGYLLEMFADAFDRFCTHTAAPHPPNLSATSATDLFSQDFSRFRSATGDDDVADRKDKKPLDINDVADVADRNGDSGDACVFCTYCGRPGGNEVAVSGRTARLHRDCEEPYWRFLDEGHGQEDSPADPHGPLSGWAVAKGEHGETRARHPDVTFFGVEPFGPCAQCGKTGGVVHHVRVNRHLGRRSLNLHEACIASWLASHDEED